MLKYGSGNTLLHVKPFGIIANKPTKLQGPMILCNEVLEQLFNNVLRVVGYASEVIYKNKHYDFVLLTESDGDINVALILLDEFDTVNTDREVLKNGISLLRIDDKHFMDMENIILRFIEESSNQPIISIN